MPVITFHRNDQPTAFRADSGGTAPVIVAETYSGPVLVLAPADLDACSGSVERLHDAIEQAAARHGLTWPSD